MVTALESFGLKTLWSGDIDVVRLIQTRTRGFLAHLHYRRLQCQALVVQALARQVNARRRFLRQKKAFTTTQAFMRRRRAVAQYEAERNGILVAQSMWIFTRKKRALRAMQRVLRGRLQRLRYVRVQGASLAMQSGARGRRDRKRVSSIRARIYTAATAIQSAHRAMHALHCYRAKLVAHHAVRGASESYSASEIQRWARRVLALRLADRIRRRNAILSRERIARRVAQEVLTKAFRLHATIAIESCARGMQDRMFTRWKRAAIRIQTSFRRRHASCKAWALRVAQSVLRNSMRLHAARTIHNAARGRIGRRSAVARRAFLVEEKRLFDAAARIQQQVRLRIAARQALASRVAHTAFSNAMRRNASYIIERRVRVWLAGRRAAEHREARNIR